MFIALLCINFKSQHNIVVATLLDKSNFNEIAKLRLWFQLLCFSLAVVIVLRIFNAFNVFNNVETYYYGFRFDSCWKYVSSWMPKIIIRSMWTERQFYDLRIIVRNFVTPTGKFYSNNDNKNYFSSNIS